MPSEESRAIGLLGTDPENVGQRGTETPPHPPKEQGMQRGPCGGGAARPALDGQWIQSH